MTTLQPRPIGPVTKFYGWRMIAIAFACTNIGLSFTFGVYGTFVAEISKEFPASRSLLSGGLALVMTMMGVLAPVVGIAIGRWSIKRVFMIGMVLMAATFCLISLSHNAWEFVLIFGIVGGAAATFGIFIPSVTLASQWFIKQRGRATGFVMMPLFMVVVPPAAAASMAAFGWRITGFGMAGIALLVLPILSFLVDRPEDIGQKPLGDYGSGQPDGAAAPKPVAVRPLHSAAFWIIAVGGGIVNSSSITITTHLILFATGKGVPLQSAAFLLSILAGAGMFGGVICGSLSDRLGGALTLALIAAVECLCWPALLLNFGYWYLAALVGIIGICANGTTPAAAALLTHYFGRDSIGKMLGYFSLATMPLNFIMPLLTGLLFDISGSYRLAFLIYAALFLLGAIVMLPLRRDETKERATDSGIVGAT